MSPQEILGVAIWAAIKSHNNANPPPETDPQMEAFWSAVAVPLLANLGDATISLINLGNVGVNQSFNPASRLTTLILTATIQITLENSGAPARGTVKIMQDAIGGRNVTWAGAKFAGGSAPVLATNPNAVSLFDWVFDGTDWILTAFSADVA